jgi:hypothetical protein
MLNIWKNTSKTILCDCSRYLDNAELIWFDEIFSKTFAELGDPGSERMAQLDKAMIASCKKLPPTQELKRELTEISDEYIELNGRPITSRQIILWMFRHFETNGHMDTIYNIIHIMEVEWRGDSEKQIRAFMHAWNQILKHIKERFNPETLRDIFEKQMMKSTIFIHAMEHYTRHKMRKTNNEDYSYEYMIRTIETHLQAIRDNENERNRKLGLRGDTRNNWNVDDLAAAEWYTNDWPATLTKKQQKAVNKLRTDTGHGDDLASVEDGNGKGKGKGKGKKGKGKGKGEKGGKGKGEKGGKGKDDSKGKGKGTKSKTKDGIDSPRPGPAPAAGEPDPRPTCWFHNAKAHGADGNSGGCSNTRDDCRFQHNIVKKEEFLKMPKPASTQYPRSQSPAKAQSRASASPSPSGTKPCREDMKKKGSCTISGCKYKHYTNQAEWDAAKKKSTGK